MERKQYLDLMRGLATIAVILIHVSSNNWYGFIGSRDWIVFSVCTGVGKVFVPLFFMISGVLFLDEKKDLTLTYIFRHILKLLIFLLVWAFVYQVINGNMSPLTAFGNILQGDTQTHLWFIYTMVGLYILAPLLSAIVKYASKDILFYMICICFLFGSILPMLNGMQITSVFTPILNKINPGIETAYAGYFLLGYYLDRYHNRHAHDRYLYLAGALSTVVTILLVIWDCMHTGNLEERFWTYSMPGIAIASAAVFLFIKDHCKENRWNRILQKISKRSLGIYGSHFIFIICLWNYGITTFSFISYLSVPFLTVIVLAASYTTAFLLSKLPFGKYIA